ncbi:GNAT family N-acetyltransferase [Heyndrickxia sp. MSNUG]|uniref:GNAT family N-acetyltransferase n=1 Tax=Heyndrickxia sp. MSNUG TaxID=3136677 RepID=UPI003C2EE1A0
MKVTLKPITKENWEEAIDLTVKEEQKHFIASNLYSIAEVQFLGDFKASGIYYDEKMIGFAMYGIDPDDNNFWIYRLMIDQAYQGNGFGAAAVKLIVEEIKSNNSAYIPFIMIGYHPENEGARYAYKKAGFVETERAPWGEQLAAYNLGESIVSAE